jgi:hypothetical protein
MSVFDDYLEKYFKLEVDIRENHLEGHEGTLFATPVNNTTFNDLDVCVAACKQGGFSGSVTDMHNAVTAYLRQTGHIMRNGGRVNIGGFVEIGIAVGGKVESEFAKIDQKTNRIHLGTRALPGARALYEGVEVINRGMAPDQNYIMAIIDTETGTTNLYITKNGIFTILGHRIKIVGDPALTGLYFFSPGTPTVTVKLTTKLATNDPSKLVGIVPEVGLNRDWYPEVRTFYSGSGSRPLKELRIIRSKFPVRQLAS